jgi:hypothetical protein
VCAARSPARRRGPRRRPASHLTLRARRAGCLRLASGSRLGVPVCRRETV